MMRTHLVIPAKAGISLPLDIRLKEREIPAFAGMTEEKSGDGHHDVRHQKLRHGQKGARLAGGPRRRLCVSRLQACRDRRGAAQGLGGGAGLGEIAERAGTTFRKLPDADKADIDLDKAVALMLALPSMIRRPVLDLGDRRLLGFDAAAWAAAIPA
jgi:hypothetical protein